MSVTQWSKSLEIKGLLKQVSANFNVSAAWKNLVGWEPNSDRSLEWSDENAAILRRKLEFHQGTPEQLAHEARRLEKTFRHEDVAVDWTMADSRVATSTSPALADPRMKTWPKLEQNGSIAPVPYTTTGDVEMKDRMMAFF